jgi:hypothetical protein
VAVQNRVNRVLELAQRRERLAQEVADVGLPVALTNSATSLALPLSDSLCTLDLSFSGAADAMVVNVGVLVNSRFWLLGSRCRNRNRVGRLQLSPTLFTFQPLVEVVRGCGWSRKWGVEDSTTTT